MPLQDHSHGHRSRDLHAAGDAGVVDITNQAKALADSFRSMAKDGRRDAYHVQLKAYDGTHRWLMLTHKDMKSLSRDKDLQAVCQAMLYNHGIVPRPPAEAKA